MQGLNHLPRGGLIRSVLKDGSRVFLFTFISISFISFQFLSLGLHSTIPMTSMLRNIIVVGGSYVGKVSALGGNCAMITYSLCQTTAQELARLVPETHRV